jgi:hypothetical protein
VILKFLDHELILDHLVEIQKQRIGEETEEPGPGPGPKDVTYRGGFVVD